MGATGTFPNKQVVDTLSQTFDGERVASVKFRFDNEEILGARARERVMFGWGGFGRNRVFDEYGKIFPLLTACGSLYLEFRVPTD